MNFAYLLVRLFLFGCALQQWPRSRGSATFWLLLGLLFAFGDLLSPRCAGCLLLGLVVLDAAGTVRSEPGPAPLDRVQPGIVWPVLLMAVVLSVVGVAGPQLGWDAGQSALYGLTLGSLAGAGLALWLTGEPVSELLRSGSSLNQTIGSVSLLPQLLASLGAVLAAARLGPTLAHWLGPFSGGHALGAVLVTCVAMSSLAALTGNSFAAFPVVAGGVLVPLVLQHSQADPSALAIWTLTVGASGTLITPMAANFNLVPAALLNLPDRYDVLRRQWPFGVAMWLGHLAWMSILVAVAR